MVGDLGHWLCHINRRNEGRPIYFWRARSIVCESSVNLICEFLLEDSTASSSSPDVNCVVPLPTILLTIVVPPPISHPAPPPCWALLNARSPCWNKPRHGLVMCVCVHAESEACSLSHVERVSMACVVSSHGWRASLVLCSSPACR
jgi:hypothetical protein